jgi:pimeloyl-ACP methyl ester carboxylesterase
MKREVLATGEHPEQRVEIRTPDSPSDPAPVLLIHGGCWRARYDLHLEDACADDLAARGYVVWNVEYRRLDAGGTWPEPLLDVVAAIRRCPTPPVVIGHSAGGYLALLAAREAPVRAVIAQAPVTSLPLTVAHGACVGAAERLIAAGAPSPADTPPTVPHVVIHGDADTDVPLAVLATYTTGERVVLPGCGHLEHLDPASDAWAVALIYLASFR